jgi:hypothetical protein
MFSLSLKEIDELYNAGRDTKGSPLGWVGNQLIVQDFYSTNHVYVLKYSRGNVEIDYILSPKESYKFKKAAIENPCHEKEV